MSIDREISQLVAHHQIIKRQNERPGPSNYTVDPGTSYEKKLGQKSTAYSATKLVIDIVKEASDVFPPLKSVAGGLSAILNHCDEIGRASCRERVSSPV